MLTLLKETMSMSTTGNVVVITGASSGFGALTVRALADAAHTVYAGMRQTTGRNAPQVQAAADYAHEHNVDRGSRQSTVTSTC